MIIFKMQLTVVMVFGLLSVAVILADALTDLRYEWLDNLAQHVIVIFLHVLAFFLAVGFVCVCGFLIWTIWTHF